MSEERLCRKYLFNCTRGRGVSEIQLEAENHAWDKSHKGHTRIDVIDPSACTTVGKPTGTQGNIAIRIRDRNAEGYTST